MSQPNLAFHYTCRTILGTVVLTVDGRISM
jgi:hypothetical protein